MLNSLQHAVQVFDCFRHTPAIAAVWITVIGQAARVHMPTRLSGPSPNCTAQVLCPHEKSPQPGAGNSGLYSSIAASVSGSHSRTSSVASFFCSADFHCLRFDPEAGNSICIFLIRTINQCNTHVQSELTKHCQSDRNSAQISWR